MKPRDSIPASASIPLHSASENNESIDLQRGIEVLTQQRRYVAEQNTGSRKIRDIVDQMLQFGQRHGRFVSTSAPLPDPPLVFSMNRATFACKACKSGSWA